MTIATRPTTAPVTFTKLRAGGWGVRFPFAKPRHGAGPVGEPVEVTKRDGSTEWVVPTKFVFGGNDYSVYAFTSPGDNTHPLIAPDMPVRDHTHENDSGIDSADVRDVVPVVPTDRLFYHGATRTFSCEISELSDLLPGPTDAIVLQSHVTGNNLTFRISRVEKDRDGITIAWEYLSEGTTGMKLTLFND